MQDGLKTMDDQRIKEIRNAAAKASPAPWKWAYDIVEEPTDDPELLNLGIGTSLAGFEHHSIEVWEQAPILDRVDGYRRCWRLGI